MNLAVKPICNGSYFHEKMRRFYLGAFAFVLCERKSFFLMKFVHLLWQRSEVAGKHVNACYDEARGSVIFLCF